EQHALRGNAGYFLDAALDVRRKLIAIQAEQVEGYEGNPALLLAAGLSATFGQHQRGGPEVVVDAGRGRPAGKAGEVNANGGCDHRPRHACGETTSFFRHRATPCLQLLMRSR